MSKTTKRENFTAIIAELEKVNRPDLVEAMKHEIELLDRKNATRSNKPSKAQEANEAIRVKILETLTPNQWYTLSGIKELIPELQASNGTQKTSAVVRPLVEAGKLERMTEKRVVYLKLADAE